MAEQIVQESERTISRADVEPMSLWRAQDGSVWEALGNFRIRLIAGETGKFVASGGRTYDAGLADGSIGPFTREGL